MSVDINKTIAEASLDKLHDIIVPEPIGLFPLAPGWYVVGLLVLALLFHFGVFFYNRYTKALYRREALEELHSVSEQGREEILQLLTLAKRTAIGAYGREKTATLSEESWWDFMEEHSKVKVSQELRTQIENFLYDDTFPSDRIDTPAIKAFVTLWIKTHKVSEDV